MHAISVKVTGLVAVVALAAAGLVAVATSTAHAASAPCQREYTSSPALAVQDTAAGSIGTLDSWSIMLRYRSCDLDSDGVEDHADACLGVAAHTATGCRLTTRAVMASYRKGRVKGVLSSAAAGCKAARPVTVWKVRSGPDEVIGTKTTRADGRYRLTRAKKEGKYYATSPRVVVAGVAECPAVRSARFRIR